MSLSRTEKREETSESIHKTSETVESMDTSESVSAKRRAETSNVVTSSATEDTSSKKAKIESTQAQESVKVEKKTDFSSDPSTFAVHTTEKAKDKCKRCPVFMETAKSQVQYHHIAATTFMLC
jgi:hypothetical protein